MESKKGVYQYRRGSILVENLGQIYNTGSEELFGLAADDGWENDPLGHEGIMSF